MIAANLTKRSADAQIGEFLDEVRTELGIEADEYSKMGFRNADPRALLDTLAKKGAEPDQFADPDRFNKNLMISMLPTFTKTTLLAKQGEDYDNAFIAKNARTGYNSSIAPDFEIFAEYKANATNDMTSKILNVMEARSEMEASEDATVAPTTKDVTKQEAPEQPGYRARVGR